MTTETAQAATMHDPDFDHLEATISDEAYEQVGAQVQQQPDNTPATKDILEPVLAMGFGVLAPNWQVQPQEVEQLADVYAQLLDKYFPDGLGDYGVEISAVMVTGAIVLPRLKTPRKVEQVEEVEKDAA